LSRSNYVREHVRPDGHCLVRSAGAWTHEGAAEAVEHARRREAPALAHVDERETDQLAALAQAGFVVARREARVVFEIERGLEVLEDASLPAGLSIRSAADVAETELRLLDDELRQDVPGTSGWRSTPEEFREHTFADPAFDPRTYLVAVDRDRRLIGLVRIWMNPDGPRLGMLGVRREHRRRGIGAALLAEALRAVQAAGAAEVTSEHDLENRASSAMAERLGARRIGVTLELVYEPRVREASGVG
jgi:RimJ/RimL family protein N-acetyltransferase